jgi:hypothetical protein
MDFDKSSRRPTLLSSHRYYRKYLRILLRNSNQSINTTMPLSINSWIEKQLLRHISQDYL